MTMRATELPLPPAVDDRELTGAEVLERANRFAVRAGKPSFDAMLAGVEAGEFCDRPEELRARMFRHLLGR